MLLRAINLAPQPARRTIYDVDVNRVAILSLMATALSIILGMTCVAFAAGVGAA